MKRMLICALALVVVGLGPASLPVQAEPPTDCAGDPINDPHATDVDDYLSGTPDRDVIALGDGADQYFAGDGNDELCGNNGPDLLVGEGDDDFLSGGDGDDHLVGMPGQDSMFGGYGSDTLEGDGAADVLRASAEDSTRDDIFDGRGPDTIVGQAEDFWHKCDDGDPDDHDAFTGTTIPDPDC